jgi:hypothetical protein
MISRLISFHLRFKKYPNLLYKLINENVKDYFNPIFDNKLQMYIDFSKNKNEEDTYKRYEKELTLLNEIINNKNIAMLNLKYEGDDLLKTIAQEIMSGNKIEIVRI